MNNFKKVIIEIHKYVGTLMSLLFVMWCMTGFVLLFAGFPHASRQERFLNLEYFSDSSFSDIQKLPNNLGGFSLEMHNGKPVYRIKKGKKAQKVYNAKTAEQIESFSFAECKQVAESFFNQKSLKVDTLTEIDSWIPWNYYKPLLPFYKFYFNDNKHTVLYVSPKSGDIIQQTTRKTRWLARVGAIPHWIYFKQIKGNPKVWKKTVLIFGIFGILACLSGIILGFFRFKRGANGRLNNITVFKKATYKYHHTFGLFFGLILCTYTLSGIFYGSGSSKCKKGLNTGASLNRQWNNEEVIPTIHPYESFKQLPKKGGIRKLEFGEAMKQSVVRSYYSKYKQPDVFIVDTAGKLKVFEVDTVEVLSFAKELYSNENIKISLQTEYDFYYEECGMFYHPLPAFKLKMNNEFDDVIYIDPHTGKSVEYFNKSKKIHRVMTKTLHKLELPILYKYNTLRIIVSIILLLGCTVVSCTSLLLGVRFIKRKLGFIKKQNCKTITVIALLLLVASSCQTGVEQIFVPEASTLDYSKGFRIDSMKNKTMLTIYNPKDSTNILGQFVLYPKSYTGKLKQNEIKIPCEKIICLSSTQLAYLIELDALESVAGINSSRHLFNKQICEAVEEGKIKQVGKEGVFNTEIIAAINPDVIFVSPFKTGGYDALRNLGIPLVPMAAYSEQLPLGRAEWIKFMALFAGKQYAADSIFSTIADEYNRLTELTKNIADKPTVFSGKMKGGTWYVAGGKSFFAHMFRDAGADYVIKNDKTGAVPMDYESIYAKAYNAKYWRLLTSSPKGFGKEMLKNEDVRYTDFEAYKTGNILVCNLREVPYREESCIKPHILLADYIYQFHRELLPDYTPVYWKKIGK